jgi:hypothetical protein
MEIPKRISSATKMTIAEGQLGGISIIGERRNGRQRLLWFM